MLCHTMINISKGLDECLIMLVPQDSGSEEERSEGSSSTVEEEDGELEIKN